MKVDLVVFDMAGTTVYDGDAVHSNLYKALSAAGAEASRDEINSVMGIAKPLAIRKLLTSHHLEDRDLDEAVDTIHADFLSRMLAHYGEDPSVREIEGACKVFQLLREAGVRVGLDTGFSRDIADVIIERLGWGARGLINASVTSDEVDQGRPFPDMIFRLMELTNAGDPERVAKVGDTPSDLLQGTAAGCGYVVGVTQGSHTQAELEPYPHTHLIQTIAGLPELLR